MQAYLTYLKELTDQELTTAVENIFHNDTTDGQALADNQLVSALIHSEAIPLAAFEKATLLEFIWRGLQVDRAGLALKMQGDFGVDLAQGDINNVLSTREMN